jgi:hypothetical protein
MKAVLTLFLVIILPAAANAQQGVWIPNALFKIEDANPQQIQIFVSGLSYGLTSYSQQLEKMGKPRLFCVPGNGLVTSPMIYDILNTRFKGKTIEAKQATLAAITGLQEKFPCK